MKFLASPNFNERFENQTIKFVVVHYTGMKSAQDALNKLRDPKEEVSAHYMIDEDGSIVQMVDERLRAWHAGKSKWKNYDDLNSASIGIELVNPGHEFGYNDFTEPQMKCLTMMLKDIFKRRALPPEALLAHSDIAPLRKQDPGEKFPWEFFAKQGFGLWPKATDTTTIDENKIEQSLSQIGYNCSNLNAALTAFQRRYCPEELGTQRREKTCCQLTGLIKLLT